MGNGGGVGGRLFGPGTPEPDIQVVERTFNIYMWSDEKYKWKDGRACVDVCMGMVWKAADKGEPSV